MSLPFSKDVAIIIVRSSFKLLSIVQLKSFSEKVVSFCFSTLLFCFVFVFFGASAWLLKRNQGSFACALDVVARTAKRCLFLIFSPAELPYITL